MMLSSFQLHVNLSVHFLSVLASLSSCFTHFSSFSSSLSLLSLWPDTDSTTRGRWGQTSCSASRQHATFFLFLLSIVYNMFKLFLNQRAVLQCLCLLHLRRRTRRWRSEGLCRDSGNPETLLLSLRFKQAVGNPLSLFQSFQSGPSSSRQPVAQPHISGELLHFSFHAASLLFWWFTTALPVRMLYSFLTCWASWVL